MHEASIVESLLRQVGQKTPPRAEVHRVHVRVGRLTNVCPDALNFYFEALRNNPLSPHSQLIINQPSLVARCQSCGRKQEFVEWTWECPLCKSGPLIFLNGSELELEAIEVEDNGNHSHRRKDSR